MGLVKLDDVTDKMVNLVATVDVVDGNLLAIGAQESFGVNKGDTPTAITNDLAFVANDFVSTHVLDREEARIIKAGTEIRGYLLKFGDVVTVTNDLIDGTPVLNQFVIPQAGLKLKFSAILGATESLAFQIDEINDSLGGFPATVLRVVRNR